MIQKNLQICSGHNWEYFQKNVNKPQFKKMKITRKNCEQYLKKGTILDKNWPN